MLRKNNTWMKEPAAVMEGPNVELGEPGVNVNPYVVGLDDGLPGITMGPAVVETRDTTGVIVTPAIAEPGVTVSPAVVKLDEGPPGITVCQALGESGVIVDPNVVGQMKDFLVPP